MTDPRLPVTGQATPPQWAHQTAPTAPPVNPLMAKVKLPGSIFQLPSRGVLYRNGELSGDCSEGEVHVHPLSAIAEINIKNPDLLFSGKAIDIVFRECVPQIQKPLELYTRDVDAILLFLRSVTYGEQYEILAQHDCPNAKEHSYITNIGEVIAKIKYLDPTTFDQDYFVTIPNGQRVEMVPVRYNHLVQLLQMNQGKKEFTAEDVRKAFMFNMLAMIKSVDGETDKRNIEEWIRTVPAPWTNRVTDAIEKANAWGPDLSTSVKCRDCGEELKLDLPINPVNFFTE